MITPQILSIVAFVLSCLWFIPFILYHFALFSISWIEWVALIVGVICFIQLQVIWCCRRSKIGLYITALHSTIAAVTCSIAAIVMTVVEQSEVGLIVFVTAMLWFGTTGCILYFVKSGRHTRWEEKLKASVTTTATTTVATTLPTTAIEMRTLQHHQDNSHHPQVQQSTIAVITASATAATSYVLPDILDKSDDV